MNYKKIGFYWLIYVAFSLSLCLIEFLYLGNFGQATGPNITIMLSIISFVFGYFFIPHFLGNGCIGYITFLVSSWIGGILTYLGTKNKNENQRKGGYYILISSFLMLIFFGLVFLHFTYPYIENTFLRNLRK